MSIGLIILGNGIVAGLFSLLSYSLSVKKYTKDILDKKIDGIEDEIRSCFDDISLFLTLEDNLKKDILREKIDLKIENIRQNILKYHYGELQSNFANFALKISDLTYENEQELFIDMLSSIKILIIDINKDLNFVRNK